MMTAVRIGLAASLVALAPAFGADAPEAFRSEFTATYCQACHGGDNPNGGFRADPSAHEFQDEKSREQWARAGALVNARLMPPPQAPQPAADLRERFSSEVQVLLASGQPEPSDGLVRRMNRIEYLNTLRDLFGIREIRLPVTYPDDPPGQHFDTMVEGMHLTPGHLDAYHQVAIDIADRMVPLPGMPVAKVTSVRASIGQDPSRTKFFLRDGDETGLYFTGVNIAGWSGALWDRAFIAQASGVYRVRVKASAEAEAGADGKPLRLGFYALNPGDYLLPKRALRVDLPRVGELIVRNREPEILETEVHLERGENFQIYCENRLRKQYPPALIRTSGNTLDLRRLLATYLEESYESPEPTIRFESIEISGPIGPLPRQVRFLGGRTPPDGRAAAEAILLPLAERAFRRPLTTGEREDLISSALSHAREAADPAYGIHYGVRKILLSPQFLYRESGSGALDDYGLASRLSYFLWSSMPDARLLELAAAGRLKHADVLDAEIVRMVRDAKAQRFVKHFTGQWLGNRKASAVMVCDVRHVWSELIRHGMVRGTEMFFDEILQHNRSIRTFIDSDFTYANEPMRIAWGMPGNEVDLRRLEADQRQSLLWPEPERLEFASLGPDVPAHVKTRGGVLGLSGVFTATGDGVQSSPILRGVWVLENLLGRPPPPPPSDVPALVADISQAKSVREVLAAHQQIESCAICHSAIDPIGLALENYDAAGGWRTSYYREEDSAAPRTPVQTVSEMPDGTKLAGAQDLKDYIMASPEDFTRTLTGLLIEYGTGRELTARDRGAVQQIVADEPEGGYGFRDLIARVVSSESFATRQ